MIDDALKEYGERIGVADLKFNESGILTLRVQDQELHLQRNDGADTLLIVCLLGVLSTDPHRRLYELEYIAKMNCLGIRISGGHLGIDNERLFYSVELGCNQISSETLDTALHSIAKLTRRLWSELQNPIAASPEETLKPSQNWICI